MFITVRDIVDGTASSQSGKIYKSSDAGKSWELQNTKMEGLSGGIEKIYLATEVYYSFLSLLLFFYFSFIGLIIFLVK